MVDHMREDQEKDAAQENDAVKEAACPAPAEAIEEDAPAAAEEASEQAVEDASPAEGEEPVAENADASEQPAEEQSGTEGAEHAPDDTADATPAEEELAAQAEPARSEGPLIRYRWNYETQRATDEQLSARGRRRGIVTYAVVMTCFFVASFAILVLSLLTGGLTGRPAEGGSAGTGGDSSSGRVVYIREDDGESGVLTIQEIAEQSCPAVVAVTVKKSLGQGVGTGFVLREDGYIATNYHVVEDGQTVTVVTYDGEEYEAEVVNYSEPDDLAVLKIDAEDLPVLPIGDSDDVLVGDDVVVIGHPAGLSYGWSTTNGILSAINREVKIKNSDGTLNKKMTLLQTNANVNSGNSGGPMLNEYGEVIGIISMKLADGYEGMGFAIPINGAMEIIEAIIEKGHADDVNSSISKGRPVLGVTGFDVVEGLTVIKDEDGNYSSGFGSIEGMTGTIYEIDRAGFFIIEVSPNGDAYGKLQEGDLIFAVDGVTTASRAAMMAIMNEKDVGDSVVVDYVRNGEIHSANIELTLAEAE